MGAIPHLAAIKRRVTPVAAWPATPVALAALSILGACAPAPQRPPAPVPPAATPAPEAPADARVYTVDENASEMLIYVTRGGALSRFGHNHVVGGQILSGEVRLADTLGESTFSLVVHPERFVVDRPAWRAAAGEGYDSVPSEEDVAGTRENMLSEEVLDAAQYPRITIESAGVLGELPEFSLLARVTLKGSTRSVPVPVTMQRADGRITATGSLRITQSDFGIEPFSILLGAISVKDDLRIEYRLVATERPETP